MNSARHSASAPPPASPRPTAANDFPPIAVDPARPHDSIRALYLANEPELLACIRRGDRRGAIRLVNLVLVHIYSAGQERSDYLKSLLLELVVMMSRAAIEAGASPTEVLGLRFRHLTELAALGDDEELAAWLRKIVLNLFEVVARQREPTIPAPIARALRYLREHAAEPITRDALAAAVGTSPSHLARGLRAATGRSFAALLREARVAKACELLARTDLTLAAIAAECGFCDQSYLTHVFQELRHTTPGSYREALRRTPSAPSSAAR